MDAKSTAILEATPSSIEWVQSIELSYETTQASQTAAAHVLQRCFYPNCPNRNTIAASQQQPRDETNTAAATTATAAPPSVAAPKLLQCSKCRVASYCQRDCQVRDWKARHKLQCPSLQRVGPSLSLAATDAQTAARNEILQRIRFYACAYAVAQHRTLGRGFLFCQSDQTLALLSLQQPLLPHTGRAVLLHYLTLGEYDTEVCRDDFEMATLRPQLHELVSTYDDQTQLVWLTRFRCGHVALGRGTLVPDYKVCRKIGHDYFGDAPPPSLQLNIDDV